MARCWTNVITDPMYGVAEDGDDGRYEPEEVPQDGTLLDE
jgi:hypothetical protein